MSLAYFMKLTIDKNMWISSESSGIGTHKLINRIVNKGTFKIQRAHRNDNAIRLSNLVNFYAGIYKKDGKYYPKLN